ncbi:MAG: hypothetical protein SchgKO_12340 [Schleiferiaceae bacterium]
MSFQPERIQHVLQNIPSFRAGESIRSAFTLFGKDAGTPIFALIILILISAPIEYLDEFTNEYGLFSGAYGILVSPILSAGWLYIAHNVRNHGKGNVGDLFAGFKDKAGTLIVLNILVSIITLAAIAIPLGLGLTEFLAYYASSGFDNNAILEYDFTGFTTGMIIAISAAFILGFYFTAAYFLAPAFVVFFNLGAWEAMEASRKVFNKNIGSYIAVGILLILLNIGGAIALLIGLLVTIPVSAYTTYTIFQEVADLPDNDEDSLLDELQEG